MKQQVDFSKIAARPYVPAIDRNDNLVYISAYEWWYIDSDGSIVLDFDRFISWARSSGYTVVNEPFVHCDENDCYRDWIDCDRFILYLNYEVIEFNERVPYLKVRRKSDGVVFKIMGQTENRSKIQSIPYLFLELDSGMTFCEVIVLFTALLAKLGLMRKEEQELLEKDHVALMAKYGEMLTDPLTVLGVAPGLLIVEKKELG